MRPNVDYTILGEKSKKKKKTKFSLSHTSICCLAPESPTNSDNSRTWAYCA